MKRVSRWISAAAAVALAVPAAAEPDRLGREEAVKLVKGQTAEGSNLYWKKKMTWYFHESGQVRKLDELGNLRKAGWWIDAEGRLCHQDKHMKEEQCSPIVPRDDGGYDLPDLHWRWEKVVPGNPRDL